jgi:hypothetical protein
MEVPLMLSVVKLGLRTRKHFPRKKHGSTLIYRNSEELEKQSSKKLRKLTRGTERWKLKKAPEVAQG